MCLNNLANALHRRFERMDSMEDLDRAVTLNQQAVDLTKAGYKLHKYLNSLAYTLRSRFSRTKLGGDLDRAIDAMQRAISLLSAQNCNTLKYLDILAGLLEQRSIFTNRKEDLKQVLELNEQIVDACPENHPNRPMYLTNLGSRYLSSFEQTKEQRRFGESC